MHLRQSRTVRGVEAQSQEKISTGQNCFRFLVPTEEAMRSPLAKSLIDRIGLTSLNAFISETHRLIIYPCRAGKLLNLALMCPEGDMTAEESSWLNSGSKDDLMREVQGFSSELREICSLAEDVKLWSLASRDPPTVFHRGKLCLIGDAAHPTLPRTVPSVAGLRCMLTTHRSGSRCRASFRRRSSAGESLHG